MLTENAINFIKESNRIEGIDREPTKKELSAFASFLALEHITIKDLEEFISVYAPGHRLRDKEGLNVSIGGYYAPLGGKTIRVRLQDILDSLKIDAPYKTHVAYELLHPFTDGNGRSGRMLWAWQIYNKQDSIPKIGFLHSFYYQTLSAARL